MLHLEVPQTNFRRSALECVVGQLLRSLEQGVMHVKSVIASVAALWSVYKSRWHV